MTNIIPGLLVLTISLLIHLLHGVESLQIPSDKVPKIVKDAIPKHIKAMYKADKAIYAKSYGYKLIPIPNNKPPPSFRDANTTDGPTARSARTGRQAWNSHYTKGPPPRSRRRKVRPPPMRMTYTMPAYASKYKSYSPMYKKRPRYSPPRMVVPGRYPPKYRMPIHSNVIEPVEDYSDEEVMPDVMEEEPIVMESMGPSYSGGSMPIITSGSMGQSMSMMGPSSNDEIYMTDYDDMSSVRMPSRPVEYVADDDYGMRPSEYYPSSSIRGRGTQLRAVKPASTMYSSRYRDMRNSESRFEPEVIQRRPLKQMSEFSSSPHMTSGPSFYSSDNEAKFRPFIESGGTEIKYRGYSEPEPKYRSYSRDLLEPKFRSNVEDSDFLSSNLRAKSELPDYLRSGKYDSSEDVKDSTIDLFSRQQPIVQSSADNKWSGSLKFMPRPFAQPVESSHSSSNPTSRNVNKKTQDSSSSNHNHASTNYKFNHETPSSHTKQSALTIHDLLLQQAKQIQQSSQESQSGHSGSVQGRDLGDDYTNVNDFLVYNGPSGEVFKPTAQRYRSSEGSGISRRSTAEAQPQYHRYTRPSTAPDLNDMDAVLDSLPWKVNKK